MPLSQDRILPGIDWNDAGQLSRLAAFEYSNELVDIQNNKAGTQSFDLNNPSFQSGDAEF